jgi:hypothetical protein
VSSVTNTLDTPAADVTTGARHHRWVAAFCALVALTAYGGAVAMLAGALSFGTEVEARLPWQSYPLAAAALTAFVAVPMTLAAVTSWRGSPTAPAWVFVAGLAQVVWIGLQLAFIQTYSPFHPIYLGVGAAALGLAWSIRDDTAAPAR